MKVGRSIKKLVRLKKVSDNYENYSYHERYLDAFASIFAICDPVSAVLFYNKKFYISYNKSLSPQKQSIAQDILNCLNDVLSNKKLHNELLTLYLHHNTDYINNLKKYIKKLDDNLGQLFLSQDSDLPIELLAKIIFENNTEITNFSDNIRRFHREWVSPYIDYGDIESIKTWLLDIFANKTNRIDTAKQDLKQLLQNHNASADCYMKLIKHLIEVKDICNHDEFVKLTSTLIRPLQDVEKLIHYLKMHPSNLEEIEVEFLENPKLGQVIDIEKLDKYLANEELRLTIEISPNTTIDDILDSLQKNNDNFQQPKIKQLIKDLYLHAEMNLAKHFPHLENIYIGVSRLCCGGCDDVLENIYHYKHRGTHGTLDAAWTMVLMQFADIAIELENKAKYFRQDGVTTQLSLQDRELSDDEAWSVEKDLFVDVNFDFKNYKQIFGIYDECNALGNYEYKEAE